MSNVSGSGWACFDRSPSWGLPELTASESMNSSPFGELQAGTAEKRKRTEGVYRLVEGTRMRVVESKSWAFPKWPAQHNNTPHLGIMDAFNVCAVKYMCVCGIFIYLYSLITGEIPNKVHACAYIVCWYVVWQHRVGEQVCVCVCSVYWREPKQLGASSLPFP